MMFLLSVSFKWSIIAAIVVDFPLPAEPVIIIKPRGFKNKILTNKR